MHDKHQVSTAPTWLEPRRDSRDIPPWATLLRMSSELESVDLPAELLDQARDAVRSGAVGSVSDYVAEAVRLRLAKERALAQVTRLFGGPPPEDVVALVRQRAGLPPRRAAS